jgi:hypothetical protein
MTQDTQTTQENTTNLEEDCPEYQENEDTNINLDDINLNNINPDDINKILNGLNLGGNNLESLIQNFSKGKIGSVLKNFGDIMNNDENKNNNDENKDKVNNDLNFDISNDNLDIDEECTNDEFELDLDKYFISSEGKNICDALLDIKSELKTFNKNFATHHGLD